MMPRRVTSEGSSRTVNAAVLTLSLAVTLAVVSPALAQRPYGIDVSHWDGTIDWPQVAAAGYEFSWTKATESPYDWSNMTCGGSWYTDNTLAYNMVNAQNAGIYTGCYHFVHPQCNSASSEANGFVSRAGIYITAGYFRPVLDLEDGDSLSVTALSNWVNAWLDSVETQTGVEPIVYTNLNYAVNELDTTIAGRDLWMANPWSGADPQNDSPATGKFTTWKFWQYSWVGTVPGISTAVDLNVFNGNSAGLQAYIIGGTPIPPAFIVESRSGGQNYANYSESGIWNSGTSKSSAPGCTSGIGHRWSTIGATGYGIANFSYTPTTAGIYEVFTTNCTTSNSGNPLVHKVAHAGGTTNVNVCQNTTCTPNAVNTWYSLGQYTLNANTTCSVTLDGSTAAGSSPATTGAARSDAIKWQLVSSVNPPTITQHPSNQSVAPGGTAHFSVGASGDGSLTYQWQKNSSNVTNGGHYSGCTTATLTISNADDNDAAGYRCVVTNSYGSATSNVATLTVEACSPGTLLNGSFEGSNTSGVGASWTGYQRATNPTTSWSIQTASPPTGGGAQYQQIVNTSATGGGGVRQDITGCTVGATYTISGWMRTNSASATCTVKCSPTTSTDWATAIDLTPAQTTTSSSWVAFSGTVTASSTSMTLWLDGHTGGSGLNKAACFDAITVSGCSAPSGPTITQQPAAQNACPGATASFTVSATGSGTLSYQWQKNSTNVTNGGHYAGCTTDTLTISSTDAGDATNYRCVVTDSNGSTYSNTAALSLKAATLIAQHPSNKTVTQGQSASFTVNATGEGALSYQWQKNGTNVTDGGHYSGCTTAELTVSNADNNDATSYRCVITGGCGSVPSNAATLTVIAPTQPGDFDLDTDVDMEDFGLMQRCIGATNLAQEKL